MGVYVLRRLLSMLPTLLLSSVFVFLFIHAIPGDPALTLLGTQATPENVAATRERLGLDQPLPFQYLRWLGNVVQGDLGTSITSGREIADILPNRLLVTTVMAVLTSIISLAIAIPIGLVSAVARDRWPDLVLSAVALLWLSIPEFWVGIVLILVFALELGWMPAAPFVSPGEDVFGFVRSLLLPALALGLIQMAILARMTRSSTLEVLDSDYARTARAKGVRPRSVIVKHVLRNALLPVITVWGLNFGVVLGGAVAIETVFSLPGLGRFLVRSIETRDYPVIQGILLYVAVVYMTISLVVDVLYGLIDPRVRYD